MHTRFSPDVNGKTVNDVVPVMTSDPKIDLLLKEM